jgi:LmbE family N-acetylglucosaminyl deacetylase
VYFTRGEHGNTSVEPKPGPDELARWREQDLREVAGLIGVEDVEVRNYGDGSLDQVPQQELEEQVLNAIRRHQPDIVLTFGPGGITRHADHMARTGPPPPPSTALVWLAWGRGNCTTMR